MNSSIKKIASVFLTLIVLLCAVITILSIWNILTIDEAGWKLFQTLLVVFGATAILLFVYAMLFRDERKN